MSWAFFLFSYLINKKLCCRVILFNEIMMDKTNLPRGILTRLDKLCPSLFINGILLTRGLSLMLTKDVPTGQVCLENSPFNNNG